MADIMEWGISNLLWSSRKYSRFVWLRELNETLLISRLVMREEKWQELLGIEPRSYDCPTASLSILPYVYCTGGTGMLQS